MEFVLGALVGVVVLGLGIIIGAALSQESNKKRGGGSGFNAN